MILLDRIETDGFFMSKGLVPIETVDAIIIALEQAKDTVHARKRGTETYALRNILNAIPQVNALARSEMILHQVQVVLGPQIKPVKATLFDKTAEANWNLRWHQDNVIAVNQRKELPGFHGWTEKTGIPHVRPPVEILQQMLAARIHLDDASADNGALMVIPRSHAHGRLSEEELQEWTTNKESLICSAARGDVLFLRPLLLHCSKPAKEPQHRRILHIEYAGCTLPEGLDWGE